MAHVCMARLGGSSPASQIVLFADGARPKPRRMPLRRFSWLEWCLAQEPFRCEARCAFQPASTYCLKDDELILVTGATGFLGVQLVRELLARQPRATLALLIRNRPDQTGQQRADEDRGPASSPMPGLFMLSHVPSGRR